MLDRILYKCLPRRIARILSTGHRLYPSQLWHRVRERAHRTRILLEGTNSHRRLRARVAPASPVEAPARFKALAEWRAAHPSPACRVHGQQFRFLNESHAIGFPPDWKYLGARDAALWRFHLHYFDWLWHLDDPRAKVDVILDWIGRNPLGARACLDGPWSPYTISIRLPNWFAAFALLRDSLSEREGARVIESMREQTLYLSEHIEWEHRGNHLLENLKCLAMAAVFFDDTALLKRMTPQIHAQLDEQILPGGMHFERSPMYQALLLDHLLDLLSVWMDEVLFDRCGRMLGALRFILRPDGRVPLLGDSAWDAAPSARELLARWSGLCQATQPASECHHCDQHFVYRDRNIWLLFDAAPMGPEYIGAHQHADLLGFGLWINGREIVCDGGAGIYAEGAARRRARSAKEHAVVTVDGEGPGDPWKSFRMARQGRVKVAGSVASPGSWSVSATHDGFAWQGWGHRREITIRSPEIVLTDTIFPVTKGRRHGDYPTCCCRLPLHPSLFAAVKGDSVLVHDRDSSVPVARINFDSLVSLRIERGFRWTHFGRGRTREIVVAEFRTNLCRCTIRP